MIHDLIKPFEEIVVQSNLLGYHTKRHKLCKIEHNHRKIALNEVVIDLDTHNRRIAQAVADKIEARLNHDKLSYGEWDTSRSYHIHLFFKDLHIHSKEIRKQLRKSFIVHYCKDFLHYVDMAKCSEDVMIRDFNCRHEVTGKFKTRVNTEEPILNAFPVIILEKVLNHTLNEKVAGIGLKAPSGVTLKGVEDFVQHCLKTRFDRDGGRHMVLFKNICIAFVLLRLSTIEAEQLASQIAQNCKGKDKRDVLSWLGWAERQNNLRVSWRELRMGGFYDQP